MSQYLQILNNQYLVQKVKINKAYKWKNVWVIVYFIWWNISDSEFSEDIKTSIENKEWSDIEEYCIIDINKQEWLMITNYINSHSDLI